MMVMAKYAILT